MVKGQRDQKGRFRKGWRKSCPSVKCRHCARMFKVPPHDVHLRKFCSRRCKAESQKGQPSNRKGTRLPDSRRYWTSKRKQLLLSLWEFTPEDELLKHFPGKTWSSLKNQIRYMQIYDGIKAPKRRRTEAWKHWQEICELYLNGMGSKTLAAKYNTNHGAILGILEKNSISRRSHSEAQKLTWTPEKRRKKSREAREYDKKYPQRARARIERLVRWHENHPEFRSKKMKQWLADPKNYEAFCDTMKVVQGTPESRKRKRAFRLTQKFPLQDAKTTEVPMQNELKRRGITFKKHYPARDTRGRIVRQIDIAFPNVKLGVACDGDYWHGNPMNFKSLNEMQIKRKKMDMEQDERLRKAGWTILRFWESDIKKDVKVVVDKIMQTLRGK